MKYFKWGTLFLSLLITVISFAQERPVMKIPDVLGYKTLKCDFHMHTVFSDGLVWPTVRVDEAWRDGLDGISITDHIEYRPMPQFFSKEKVVVSDHNLPYEIAKDKAKSKDVLLIKGAEITRSMPPGHFNALFLEDANPLDTPWDRNDSVNQGWRKTGMLITKWKEAFYAAKKQGAFIIWNHPGWKMQQPDTTLWWPEHTWLFENHMMDGIEVVNGNSYYPDVYQWAIDKNLTIMAGSDSHGTITPKKRPVTLVFARDRSIDAIKEALIDHRTVVLFEDKLIGNKKFLDAIFWGSVTIDAVEKTDKGFTLMIHNPTDVPFILSKAKGNDSNLEFFDKITLPANQNTAVTIVAKKSGNYKKIDLKLVVDNLLISPGQGLPISVSFNSNPKIQ